MTMTAPWTRMIKLQDSAILGLELSKGRGDNGVQGTTSQFSWLIPCKRGKIIIWSGRLDHDCTIFLYTEHTI